MISYWRNEFHLIYSLLSWFMCVTSILVTIVIPDLCYSWLVKEIHLYYTKVYEIFRFKFLQKHLLISWIKLLLPVFWCCVLQTSNERMRNQKVSSQWKGQHTLPRKKIDIAKMNYLCPFDSVFFIPDSLHSRFAGWIFKCSMMYLVINFNKVCMDCVFSASTLTWVLSCLLTAFYSVLNLNGNLWLSHFD
jgi:hypothetical protein